MSLREYLVTWAIEVEADSPEEAARIALEIQRDKHSTATLFEVVDLSASNPEADLIDAGEA